MPHPLSGSIASLVPPDWKPSLAAAMDAPEFRSLEAFLDEEEQVARVFPPRSLIFAALAATPPDRVKAVILGQDPYPTAGNANGLAFSVSPGVKVPLSLKNVFIGLREDTGVAVPSSGDLTPWAREGVLLLNTVLTVREGAPMSHRGRGWEGFARAALEVVNAQPGPVVFLCFGKPAQKMVHALVDATRHAILDEPHPSPINGKAFVNQVKQDRPFSRTNSILEAGGRTGINWALP